ncbi:MAG TPA: serine/threonine-protein kinase [Gaiellaceae bacterium]|nr:serine/threonine-protein kinase [Gaiellaceae bacterium]
MSEELIAGRYRLLEPLGRGAMSAVWEAEDLELARHVAVKTLAPSADRQRFEREARAVAALSHANIVALYDYGESEGRPYMVLECLQGGSLEDRLAGGERLPDAETRRIAADVAAGLAHAHERGLVHRDLKPANILFDAEGRAKIADFGIARMRGTGTLTETGTVLGTASYLSPEQATGAIAGPASDVYSFGVILFRLLTGRLPFAAKNAMELVRMHRDEPPPPVRALRADAPADLVALAGASLAKAPAARPPDGTALVAALRGEGFEAATQIIAPPPRRQRLPIVAAIATFVLLVAGGALAFALTHHGGGSATTQTVPTLSLPTVRTTKPTSTSTSTPSTTTAATPTAQTTTAPTTTAPATTRPATTTAPVTTTPPPPPTTTTAPATTTAATTTDTTPTTTAETTTTAATTTATP